MCFYAGPLTYLTLLYVEATFSDKVEVEVKKPAITMWNMGHLRKRETTELDNGGFRVLPIKVMYQAKRHFFKGECNQVPHTPPANLGKQVYNLLYK
ncbi:hypothetical protein L6452_34503 [Arctium lappa]|uniref:Uncharacterized protein n=1 Tax=Arctium lappa TaxID=4217 RepID=A0ACB8YJE4_ARCLA|nr:hypothetical protein L6452_34503 [Arctium lappa]